MSKKIMLLAIAVVGAAMFALPTTAMAVEEDIPLHLVPKPVGAKGIKGGTVESSTVGRPPFQFPGIEGSASWESSTTGTLRLRIPNARIFELVCTSPGQPAGVITTEELPFHLVTLPNAKPGILITLPANGLFTTYRCTGHLNSVEIKGSGLIGTITAPACGGSATTATIKFEAAAAGVQKHKEVASNGIAGVTPTEYHLTINEGGATEELALAFEATVTFGESTKLECT